jgi:hypothetical protein
MLKLPDALPMSPRGTEPTAQAADKICGITRFGDNNLFPHFGLPGTPPD